MKKIIAVHLALAAAGLVGCGAGAPSAEPPALASAHPVAAPPPPPLATTSPPATPDPPARPASPFFVIADTDAPLSLSPMGQRAFLSDDRHLFVIDGDAVKLDAAWMAGLDRTDTEWKLNHLEGVFGVLPDAAYLSIHRDQERSGLTALWRWERDRWKPVTEEAGLHVVDLLPAGARTYALYQANSAQATVFKVIKGPPGPAPQLPSCYFVAGALGLASGDVLLVGNGCPDEHSKEPTISIARWTPPQAKVRFEPLPGVRPDESLAYASFAAVAADEIWLAASVLSPAARQQDGRPYLARFDGKEWHEEPGPSTDSPAGLIAGPDGSLWATTAKGQLFQRPRGGAFTAVVVPTFALPGDGASPGMKDVQLEIQGLWPRAAGDVWAIGATPAKPPDYSQRSVLLHTRPATAKLALPSSEALDQAQARKRWPGPLTLWCRTPFVVLSTPSKVAPPDYDYPLTRKALKGHKELAGAEFLEWTSGGVRYFGAKVPTVEMARALEKLIKRELVGSTPQAVCHEPRPDRTIAIDLVTGEIRK